MKFKPFYIERLPEHTDEMVAKAVSRALVELGDAEFCADDIPPGWQYFGVQQDGFAYFTNDALLYGPEAVEITIDQVDEHLGITGPLTDEIAGVDRDGKEWTKGLVMVRDEEEEDWVPVILTAVRDIDSGFQYVAYGTYWNFCREITEDERVFAKSRKKEPSESDHLNILRQFQQYRTGEDDRTLDEIGITPAAITKALDWAIKKLGEK